MKKLSQLETKRLLLRQWRDDDYSPFAALNNDPIVMAYYPSVLTEPESNTMAKKIEDLITQRGWGLWAVELKSNNQFIGFVGLHIPDASLPASPCVEIGWRLDKSYWGKGYATEGANAALTYAFEVLGLDDVVSFTSIGNNKSRAVMQRLNMTNTQQNFEHPILPEGHKLREHVLYKITKTQWKANKH